MSKTIFSKRSRKGFKWPLPIRPDIMSINKITLFFRFRYINSYITFINSEVNRLLVFKL